MSSIFSWWCCSCQVEGDWFWKYEAIGNSEAFIIGDVKRSILPGALAGMAAAFLKAYFSGEELEKAYADFHTAFHTAAEAAREEDSDEEETGKEN